jgi:hypothetical protein
MDLVGVGTAVCGGEQLLTLYCGRICVWPDPWTNLWDEGYPLTWENGWRDLWSLDSAPPAVEEV